MDTHSIDCACTYCCMAELEAELREARAEVERLRAALTYYADESLWEYVAVDECVIWIGDGYGWEIAARAMNPEREVPND